MILHEVFWHSLTWDAIGEKTQNATLPLQIVFDFFFQNYPKYSDTCKRTVLDFEILCFQCL